MKSRRVIVSFICIVLLITMLSGCGKDNTEPVGTTDEKPAKTEIICGEEADIKSLDPHASNDMSSAKGLLHIYNRLVAMDVNGQVVGDLAKEWEQISETEWKFKLHEGVKFHDGSELKSSDVKFSIEREKEHPRVKQLVDKVKEVEIIDDYNFIIRLNEPYAPLLVNLTQAASSILSEDAVKKAGDNYSEQPIGTGPLKFEEWIPSDRLVLTRFDDYFMGPCKVERLVLRAIPETTTRTIALETGEVDLAADLPAIDVARIKNNKDLEIKQKTSISINYLGMHTQKAPFDNVLVRQAINHAIDKQAIIDAVVEGEGKPSKTVMGFGIPGHYDEMEGFEYNVEKAKQLLVEAGYPNGFNTRISTSGDHRNRTAQLIQADLAKIGINLEIDLFEWAAFLDHINNGKHEMFIVSWVNMSLEPDGSLYPLFHSKNHGATGNRAFYANAKVDNLLDAATRESDNEKRMELYKEAQEIIVNDCPWAPLYCTNQNTGIRAGLKGLELHPSMLNRYENLYY